MKVQNSWVPALGAWDEFCRENPSLGLVGGKYSFSHLIRKYRDPLIEAGVLRKTNTHRYLINTETFPSVAFELLSNGWKQQLEAA